MMTLCHHQKTICPNHNGSFDCTPFCSICEGEQEFCAPCDTREQFDEAVKMVTDHLTDINAHTLVHLLKWNLYGCEDTAKDELMYRSYEVAKNFMYAGNLEILGRN